MGENRPKYPNCKDRAVSNLFNVEPYINMEFNEDPIVYGAFAEVQDDQVLFFCILVQYSFYISG